MNWSMLKLPPSSNTLPVKVARRAPGTSSFTSMLVVKLAFPCSFSVPSNTDWVVVLNSRPKSSNTKFSKASNVVFPADRITSKVAFRFPAGAPVSQLTSRVPLKGDRWAVSFLVPKSSLIFRRLGLMASIFRVLVNVAPPTRTRPVQLPVGASAEVTRGKAYSPSTEVVATERFTRLP